MNTVLKVVCVLGAFSWCLAYGETPDEAAKIRVIATSWERAWNTHDMKALGALFTSDADFVNVGGKHWKGRKEIEAEHTLRLGQFGQSTWTTKAVTIQSLKDDVALVHVSWGIEGDKDPDGTQRKPREGLFTWVVIKQGGEWQIRAAQNTNLSNLQPSATRK
jgi:uncharacterized protein (TIGR02246 family)